MNDQNPSRKDQKEGETTSGKSSAGVSPARFLPRQENVAIRNRGHLPHWESEAATYFVTFRLADSLPLEILRNILFAREDIPATAAHMGRGISVSEQKRLLNLHCRHIEKYLDTSAGACFLKNDIVAKVVADSLRHFDGARYRLFAWCVMPNHVHVVFQVLAEYTLPGIMHSWKSFSAKEANKILSRSGEFWQREYYDHLIRDEADFQRAVQYVLDNPKKAGIENWEWVWPNE
jgi:REP element-mobilizing transposase RayT